MEDYFNSEYYLKFMRYDSIYLDMVDEFFGFLGCDVKVDCGRIKCVRWSNLF